MIHECLEYIWTLLFKCLFFSFPMQILTNKVLLGMFICFLCPACLGQTWYLMELISLFISPEFQSWISLSTHNLIDLFNQNLNEWILLTNYFFLLLDCIWDINIINILINWALHHRTSIIVLDVSLPSILWHSRWLCKSLLPEIFNSIIIRISQKVIQSLLLSMILQFIHQSCPIPLDLLWCSNRQEDYLSKLLWFEWSEDTSSQNLSLIILLPPSQNHCFMLSIHNESHNVILRHLWKLFRYNSL